MRDRVSCDILQLYLAKGIALHPTYYSDFLNQICFLHRKGLVSPVPIALLDSYNMKTKHG
jgi:hypothetical protein